MRKLLILHSHKDKNVIVTDCNAGYEIIITTIATFINVYLFNANCARWKFVSSVFFVASRKLKLIHEYIYKEFEIVQIWNVK